MSRFIPRGVAVAGLGKRVLVAIIDALPPALIAGALPLLWATNNSPSTILVTGIAAAVLIGCYGLFQWWSYGARGAGLGARIMGLRLVGLVDGEPIGWWRFFIRQLVFSALLGTVVGGIALLVFLVIHERRQGWHDLAVGAVMVQPKVAEKRERSQVKKPAAASTVGLPPHLSSAFSPQLGSSNQSPQSTSSGSGWGSYSPPAEPLPGQARPSWLPQLEAEPMAQPQASAPVPRPAQAPFGGTSAPAPGFPQAQPGFPPSQPSAAFPQSQPSGSAFPQGQPSGPSFPSAPGGSAGSQPWSPPSTSLPSGATSPRPLNQGWIPLPTPSSIIEPPTPEAPRVRPRDFGEVDDDEGTRIAKPAGGSSSRPGGQGWYIRLDDGREVELSVPVLLGRNPQKSDSDPASHLVPAGGDGRMISRTHVLIDTDPRGVFVMDRGSTNGTALVTSTGELEPCPSDTQVRVREGQQVSYGNRWFTVLRRPESA